MPLEIDRKTFNRFSDFAKRRGLSQEDAFASLVQMADARNAASSEGSRRIILDLDQAIFDEITSFVDGRGESVEEWITNLIRDALPDEQADPAKSDNGKSKRKLERDAKPAKSTSASDPENQAQPPTPMSPDERKKENIETRAAIQSLVTEGKFGQARDLEQVFNAKLKLEEKLFPPTIEDERAAFINAVEQTGNIFRR
jgi:hypothetical protein